MIGKIKESLISYTLLLQNISEEMYAVPNEAIQESSVGQHTRHVIEFFDSLLEGYEKGIVNYENRKREIKIENSIQIACTRINNIIDAIDKLDKKMEIEWIIDQKSIMLQSSYFRELVFSFEHCIHHQALIKVILESKGNTIISKDFGVSPSTIDYKNTLCAL